MARGRSQAAEVEEHPQVGNHSLRCRMMQVPKAKGVVQLYEGSLSM